MHLRYLRYVLRHKWFVFVAGRQTRAPIWRLLVHDWSKFSRAEWGPYARRFFSGRAGQLDKSGDPDEFHRAWTHHWHNNPHHWEHWLALTNDGGFRPLEMPSILAREMVADWMGAGRAITGSWEVGRWYADNRERLMLHPATRELVEELLGLLSNEGSESCRSFKQTYASSRT